MTDYNIYISSTGKSFEKVASGEWTNSRATKFVNWPEHKARYIKLEGVGGTNDMVSAGEINIVREYSAIPLKK